MCEAEKGCDILYRDKGQRDKQNEPKGQLPGQSNTLVRTEEKPKASKEDEDIKPEDGEEGTVETEENRM